MMVCALISCRLWSPIEWRDRAAPRGGYVNLGCPLLGQKTAALTLWRGAFRGHRRQNRHTCEQNPEGREAPDRTSAHGSEEVSAMWQLAGENMCSFKGWDVQGETQAHFTESSSAPKWLGVLRVIRCVISMRCCVRLIQQLEPRGTYTITLKCELSMLILCAIQSSYNINITLTTYTIHP